MNEPPRPSKRTILGTMLGVALTAGILALIVHWKGIRLDEVARLFHSADRTLLCLAFVISALIHIMLGAHKLWLVLRAMKIDISYLDMVRVVLGMGPLQLLLPLKGGEVVAVLFFWRHERMPLASASGAIIFDRSLNFVAAGIWLLIGLLLKPGGDPMRHVLLLGVSAALVAAVFVTPLSDLAVAVASRLHPRLERLAQGVLIPWRELGPGRKLFFLGYGMVVVLRPIVVCFLLFRAYHQAPGLADLFIYTTVAVFAGHLPGPLMGMGPREGAIVGLSHGGLGGGTVALSVGLLLSLLVYVGPMLLGLPWVPWLLRRLARGTERSEQT